MTGALGTTAAGDPLAIDLDALIGSHLGVIANSGGGKSGLLRRLLETTHGRIQQIVLDGEDEFYTLREHFDYVIAGGDGGDIPATVEGAAALAIGALTHGFSLIVQLNDLGERAPEFVGKFLSALITAPRDLWHPALVVLDEVQRFAPQEGSTAASHGVKALTGQGRKRGFTAVIASQRISKVDADVRGDLNNWMLGRVGQTLDRNIMADQLGFTAREGRENLRAIEPRSFWGFGPAISAEPVLFRVSDVETTPVRPGQAKVPTPPAPEALRAILAGLTVPEAATDVDASSFPDSAPRDKEIADLRRKIADHEAKIDELHTVIAGYQRAFKAQATLLGDISWPTAPRRDGTMPNEPLVIAPVASPIGDQEAPVAALGKAITSPHSGGPISTTGASSSQLTAGARKMIDALAKHYPRALPIAHVAKIAGISIKSSQWRANLKSFEESGEVYLATRTAYSLNDPAAATYGVANQTKDPAALFEFWMRSFPPSTASMLRVIVAEAGAGLTKASIAEMAAVSPTSSGLSGGLRELREHGLITFDGERYAAAEVFL